MTWLTNWYRKRASLLLEHYLQIQLSSYAQKTMVAIYEFYARINSENCSQRWDSFIWHYLYSKKGIGQFVLVSTIKIIGSDQIMESSSIKNFQFGR